MQKFYKEVERLKPWYHDFASLGVTTKFEAFRSFPKIWKLQPGISHHSEQQVSKEKIIYPLLLECLNRLEANDEKKIILDLFCSDGYYGFRALKENKSLRLIGIDFDKRSIKQCQMMSKVLDCDNSASFFKKDARKFINTKPKCDILLNLGGIYHLENPAVFLRRLKNMPWKHQILSSAISLNTEDGNYFETPRPGWSWGSWYSFEWLKNTIQDLGYKILKEERNERKGTNLGIGGAFFLIENSAQTFNELQ